VREFVHAVRQLLAGAVDGLRADPEVAMFQTNSPVASALRTVSLRAPSVFWLAENMTMGGLKVTFWNWLKGARLWRPCASTVEIQPMGRAPRRT
jgi:hypothetical protein